jgi:hypothetical protein
MENPSDPTHGPFATEREAADAARHIYAGPPATGEWNAGNRALLEHACRAAGVALGAYDRRILAWAAIVILTPAQNPPAPTQAELEILGKFGASAPLPRHTPLADNEVLLKVFAPGCVYNKRAVLDPSGTTYVSVPPQTERDDETDESRSISRRGRATQGSP